MRRICNERRGANQGSLWGVVIALRRTLSKGVKISVRRVHIPIDNYGHWDCNNRKEDCVDCYVPGTLDWDGIGIPEPIHCRSHPDNHEE